MMSNNKFISSISCNTYKISAEKIKFKEKKRTRKIYSFTDLVEKLFEKEQELGLTK